MTRCNCPQCQPVSGSCPAAEEIAAVTVERDLAYADRKRLLLALDSQAANLRAAWAERDRLRHALSRLLPYVAGPEDEDSPGFTEALEQAKRAVERDAKEIFGAGSETWWEIPHPGTLEKVRCSTFAEAMEKWFEGFNIPALVVDGVREDFSKSCDRVRHYCAAQKKL